MEDNEQLYEAQCRKEHLKKEKRINTLLAALSILTIFSALIDAACFFDRIPMLAGVIATIISLLIVIAVAFFAIVAPQIRSAKQKGGG